MTGQFSAHRRRDQIIGLVSLVFLAGNTLADQKTTVPIQRIEVFISSERPIIEIGPKGSVSKLSELSVLIVEIDGIQSIEDNLSLNLPADSQRSKRIALQRLQKFDGQASAKLQLTAMALTKAMHYGVERTPAVVFDGETVVYGVTDLTVALEHYQAWQTRGRP